MLLPFQGATTPTRDTQGVASLALGYVLHWAFSPPLLKTCVSHNPKDNTKRLMAYEWTLIASLIFFCFKYPFPFLYLNTSNPKLYLSLYHYI